MLTRRGILLASIAAGITTMPNRSVFATAAQPSTPVNFDIPAGACDCHTHIHGDPAKFPFFAGRVYTPELASPEEMSALHKALHIERVVIVTPSVYGTDNSANSGTPVFGQKPFEFADLLGKAVSRIAGQRDIFPDQTLRRGRRARRQPRRLGVIEIGDNEHGGGMFE